MSVVLEKLKSIYGEKVRAEHVGSHWTVWVSTHCFEQSSLVEKHRQIKKHLLEFFDNGVIHALRIHITSD